VDGTDGKIPSHTRKKINTNPCTSTAYAYIKLFKRKAQSINGKMNGGTNGKMNGGTNGKMNRGTNGRMNREMNRKVNRGMNGKMNGGINRKMNGGMYSERPDYGIQIKLC
jgi:hypothetical protein